MIKPMFVAALLAGLSASALAADTYSIDPDFTQPRFEIRHLGFTTQSGVFKKVSGTITLDTAAKNGSVELTIYTDSIDMGSEAWTAHLKDEGLFNVAKYPTMTFRSTKLNFEGAQVVGVEGNLTMLAVTKPVKLAVQGFRCMKAQGASRRICGADVSAVVRRSEFGLTKYIPEVSDDIRVRVAVEAVQQ